MKGRKPQMAQRTQMFRRLILRNLRNLRSTKSVTPGRFFFCKG